MLVKGTVSAKNITAADAGANDNNTKAILKTFAPFKNCTTIISDTQGDNLMFWCQCRTC